MRSNSLFAGAMVFFARPKGKANGAGAKNANKYGQYGCNVHLSFFLINAERATAKTRLQIPGIAVSTRFWNAATAKAATAKFTKKSASFSKILSRFISFD